MPAGNHSGMQAAIYLSSRHFLHVQIVSFIHISGGETPPQCSYWDETDEVNVLFTYTYNDFNQILIKVQRRDMN
jgi:hypothetical protein